MLTSELDRLVEDLEFWGAPPEAIAEARAAYGGNLASPLYDVLQANVQAVRLFEALQTQWRWIGLSSMGGARAVRTGLDYSVIEPTARMFGIETQPDDMVRLSILEVHALNAWAEAQK